MLLVIISGEGEAIGPNATKFCSRAGHYIKAKIPVFYPDWKTDEANPEIKHGRSDAWLKGHKHLDGTMLESVQEQYQQVKLANERKRRSSLTEEGMEYYEDMDTDALA
ncbi:hypothetical protein FRX31_029695 [Thalictrum thalictroides]|uniref:Uncharacterized protein n=1 Tax=Thalictrum thalictroides TaxID=46969 RepID=A0A7J6V7H1_THATH|nr:hypothetical protein FRX31_029695 [Thalictrum thalictroides]